MEDANLVENGRFVVDFDGYNPALGYMGERSQHQKEDSISLARSLEFTESIDSYMIKQSRVHRAVIQCHNICLEILRKFGPLFSSAEDALQAMEDHLVAHHSRLVAQVSAMSVTTTTTTSQSNFVTENKQQPCATPKTPLSKL